METLRVIVDDFGAVLGKHSERLVVKAPAAPRLEPDDDPTQLTLGFGQQLDLPFKGSAPRKKEREKHEYPFFRIAEIVVVSRGVSISTDLIEECCARGIPIHFLAPGGRPYAALSSPTLNATVATRREQLRAYDDERSVILSRRIVAAKLKNQANCLRYFGKYLKQSRPEVFDAVDGAAGGILKLGESAGEVAASTIDEARPKLMAIEGRGADLYWDAVGRILDGKFPGREHRGTENPVNAALNYGYGILYSRVWASAACAGLEPFAGFMHVDRSGKPSLVLDMVEEFRQPVVDRPVIAMFNQDRKIRMEQGLLDEESRGTIADEVGKRLESPEPYDGERFRIASIIQAQARRLAVFLRGDREYEPFSMRW